MAEADATLIATRDGAVGRLLMNRPRALNALDLAMIDGMAAAIAAWREDPSLRLVLLEGAGGRAFCAGGDVRRVREQVLAGDHAAVEAFFSHEYGVNGGIAAFPRPWVSLIDGVCMGGGIGVAVHGSHRIVTEHAMLAMPETAIALFPDVGTSYVLPRLAGGLGRWLALTGARLNGAEAVEAGLATHFVPRERLEALRAALLAEGDAKVVERFAEPVAPGRIAALRPAIDRCFAHDTRAAIESALRKEDSDKESSDKEGSGWAREQLAILEHVSPTSVAVTLELLRRGATLPLPACLEMELSLTRGVTRHPDFAEGVRAVLVDKDNAPRWQPAADPVSLFG
ncbi:enoyl-CoA hydratase/isomerase family protein [Roseomonas sp. M0104]|uniref:3-hydroxyisobutyryl-CoA hydrolase n=1 Tax=Teichococcus coralli TaxID=2545983 RepID=A0A845B7Q3_9PROT|nr:enoyl-CoA hydratase/isomerase family protein [Pseudoroseomonas coralli]MXP62528.1 enoyl-CoA hydratase/isomerase family protein [Pseudoroseomonas coralli]